MATRGRKRANPFRGVLDGVSEMSRMADRMRGLPREPPDTPQRGYADAWSPATDIEASGPDLVIRCELPGVPAGEVDVSLFRGTLTISGERTRAGDEGETYVRERSYGQFRRSITLPEGVSEEHIEAELAAGVLRVTVRGAASAPGPARIDVRDTDPG